MPAKDNFPPPFRGIGDPITRAAAVTPSDGSDLDFVSRVLWVGTGGDLKVTLSGVVDPVTFPGLTVGWHPIRATRIWASGTTASGIVAGE